MFNQKELQLLKIQRKINENIFLVREVYRNIFTRRSKETSFLVREGIKNGKLKCELRI